MKKSRILLGTLIVVAALLVAVAIVLVSLVGENNKIDEVTQAFFQQIRGGSYGEAISGVQVKAPGPKQESSDSLFLLELALLERYDLLDNDNYEVITRKSHFWIPFLEENPVDVAVSLRKKPDSRSMKAALSSVTGLWSTAKDVDSVEHLLTLKRRNGNWVVESANISGSGIEKTYDDMRREFQSHQYLTEDGHGFIVRGLDVNLNTLNPLEKRFLLHVFQKAVMQIEGGPRPLESSGLMPGFRLR
jgi:hypothetical protein